MYAEVTRVLCIQMIIQVKTQKEEADQRFGRLPPIYTVGPLTPITEVSAELSSPVTTSISDFDMDLPAESDYELVLFMIIWSHACEWMEIDHADCCNAVYWLIAFWPSYMQWKIATCNLQIVRRLQIKKNMYLCWPHTFASAKTQINVHGLFNHKSMNDTNGFSSITFKCYLMTINRYLSNSILL